jgi:hypothetical protein
MPRSLAIRGLLEMEVIKLNEEKYLLWQGDSEDFADAIIWTDFGTFGSFADAEKRYNEIVKEVKDERKRWGKGRQAEFIATSVVFRKFGVRRVKKQGEVNFDCPTMNEELARLRK